ncbi:MAG: hypothetical protein DIU78_004325 [Pseudomonadota bacterium]
MLDRGLPPPALPLVVYAERLCSGARVLVVGNARSGLANRLLERGARSVHVCDADAARRNEVAAQTTDRVVSFGSLEEAALTFREASFDFALIENLASEVDPRATVRAVARLLTARGALLAAAPNPEAHRPLLPVDEGARGLDYYALYDHVSAELPHVRMLGQVPFVAYAVVDFAAEGEPVPAFDPSLVSPHDEEPDYFVALAGREPRALDEYAVVQLSARVLEPRRPAGELRAPVPAPKPAESTARVEPMARADESAVSNLREREARVERLQKEARDRELRTERLQKEAREREARAEQMEKSARELEARARAERERLEAWIRELEGRAAAADERADAADERADAAEERADAAARALEELRSRKSDAERKLQAELTSTARERDELRAEVEQWRRRATELEDKLLAKQAQLALLSQQDDVGAEEVERLEAQLQERAQEIRRLRRDLREAERVGRELVRRLAQKERSAEAAARRLVELEADRVVLGWALELDGRGATQAPGTGSAFPPGVPAQPPNGGAPVAPSGGPR